MKHAIPTFKEFLKEEQDWIESVITFKEDSQLTQKVLKALQDNGLDTGSIKSEYNAKTKKRQIRIFNKTVEDLESLFKKDEFSSLTIKNYEEE